MTKEFHIEMIDNIEDYTKRFTIVRGQCDIVEKKLGVFSSPGSNYVINCRVITAEQFGGVTNQVGLRVTYSSANGATFTDQLLVANRVLQFGSNFAYQVVNLNFTIPINHVGAPTNYFRFDVIMNRGPVGSTSVFGAELVFST
jgi:hypothetical protein